MMNEKLIAFKKFCDDVNIFMNDSMLEEINKLTLNEASELILASKNAIHEINNVIELIKKPIERFL